MINHFSIYSEDKGLYAYRVGGTQAAMAWAATLGTFKASPAATAEGPVSALLMPCARLAGSPSHHGPGTVLSKAQYVAGPQCYDEGNRVTRHSLAQELLTTAANLNNGGGMHPGGATLDTTESTGPCTSFGLPGGLACHRSAL